MFFLVYRKKLISICAVAVTVSVALAFASYFMTRGRGETEWPAMEVELHVNDAKGRPIKGANISIAGGNTSYFDPEGGVTNDSGDLTVVVKPRRWRTSHWYLFWFLPIGDSKPTQFVSITAHGFRNRRIPFWNLYEASDQSDKKTIDVEHPLFAFGDNSIEIHKTAVTLQSDN